MNPVLDLYCICACFLCVCLQIYAVRTKSNDVVYHVDCAPQIRHHAPLGGPVTAAVAAMAVAAVVTVGASTAQTPW